MKDWISVDSDIKPPNKFVKVKDEFGNEGCAKAAYYPFRIEKKPGNELKPFGLRGTVIKLDKPEWDGSWLISVTGNPDLLNLRSPLKGKVTHCKEY